MRKHLDPDTMEKELRLAFPPPLELRIEYSDHRNVMKFWVFGQNKELLYEPRALPMQGQANIRLPKHFKFHVSTGRKVVQKTTESQI